MSNRHSQTNELSQLKQEDISKHKKRFELSEDDFRIKIQQLILYTHKLQSCQSKQESSDDIKTGGNKRVFESKTLNLQQKLKTLVPGFENEHQSILGKPMNDLPPSAAVIIILKCSVSAIIVLPASRKNTASVM